MIVKTQRKWRKSVARLEKWNCSNNRVYCSSISCIFSTFIIFYKRNSKVIWSASKEIYHLAYNCPKKTKLTLLFRENEFASLKSAKYANAPRCKQPRQSDSLTMLVTVVENVKLNWPIMHVFLKIKSINYRQRTKRNKNVPALSWSSFAVTKWRRRKRLSLSEKQYFIWNNKIKTLSTYQTQFTSTRMTRISSNNRS